MEIVKRYKWVFIIVVPVVILVLIKSTGIYRFKADINRWAEPSVNGSNIISTDQIGKSGENILVVNLDKERGGLPIQGIKTITISEDSILVKKNLKTLKANDGPVILYSVDIAKQARVWMVLSQLGNRNVFILTEKQDDEVMKYKFRPDTLVKPE